MIRFISILIPAIKQTAFITRNIDMLKRTNPDIEFEVLFSSRKGFANARNELLFQAKSDYLLWFDADIELTENPLPVFMETIARNEKIVGVVPHLDWVSYNWITAFEKLFCDLGYRGYTEREAFERFFDCGFYKKKPLLESGGFDNKFDRGMEDLDLAIRLWQRGYKIIFTKKTRVKHYHHSKEHFVKITKYASAYRILKKKYPHLEYKKIIKRKGSCLNQALWLVYNSKHYLPLLPIYYLMRRHAFKLGFKCEDNNNEA